MSANRWHLGCARRVLRAGGVIAYPTEAVFGLGCDPLDADAVQRILRLKQRQAACGLILIAAELAQLDPYIEPLTAAIKARIGTTWPGPVTWVVPARPDVPGWITGAHDGIAVRVTGHPPAAALCRAAGHPLVSTSANQAGRPPARTALGVRRRFRDALDYIVVDDTGGQAAPSLLCDARSGAVLRSA